MLEITFSESQGHLCHLWHTSVPVRLTANWISQSSALSNLVMVILLGANIRMRAVCSVNTW